MLRVSGFGFRVSGFRVFGFRDPGFEFQGFRVPGSGFRVSGLGFKAQGFGVRVSEFEQVSGQGGQEAVYGETGFEFERLITWRRSASCRL